LAGVQIKIPPTNLKPGFDNPAHAFANKLADRLGASEPAR
jgi:hypothetical protein